MPGSQDKAQRADPAEPGQALAVDLDSFRSALDAGPLGMWSWDLRSHRMAWSSNLADFHGLPERKLDGTFSIVPQDFPAQEAAGLLGVIRKTLETNEPYRVEYRLPGPAGRDERWFEASATVIQEDGKAVQVLGICRDITERLRTNREVLVRARQQETLARMGERALTETDLQKFFNEVVALSLIHI